MTLVKPVIPIFIGLYYLGVTLPFINSKVTLLAIHIFALIVVLTNRDRLAYIATRDFWFISVIIFSIASVSWSNTFSVSLSGVRLLVLLFVLACYMAMSYTLEQQLNFITWTLGFTTVVSLGVELLKPNPFSQAWQGILPHKNGFAIYMVIAFYLFVNQILFRRNLKKTVKVGLFVLAAITVSCLLLSQAKAALAVFFICLPTYGLYWIAGQKRFNSKLFLSLFFLYMFLGILVTLVFGSNYIVTELLGKDLTYNGRTEIWGYLIERVNSTQPLLGFGYRGFWQDPNEWKAMKSTFSWLLGLEEGGGNSHSGFVELFLWLGWIGISMVILSILSVATKLAKVFFLNKKMEYFWSIQLLIIAVLYNCSEVTISFFGDRNYGFFIYACIVMALQSDVLESQKNRYNLGNPYLLK